MLIYIYTHLCICIIYLRWRVHLIIECYYSLATNIIHDRDVATNYIHLRPRGKCPPSRRIEISARRFLSAQTVQLWTETKAKLLNFYNKVVLPELTLPQHTHGQPIQEPLSGDDVTA